MSAPKSTRVVAAGLHDVYLRWDISTPQRVVSRLEELPGQGSLVRPGKKLFAERDRFGKWQHLLGPQHVLLSYTVDLGRPLGPRQLLDGSIYPPRPPNVGTR